MRADPREARRALPPHGPVRSVACPARMVTARHDAQSRGPKDRTASRRGAMRGAELARTVHASEQPAPPRAAGGSADVEATDPRSCRASRYAFGEENGMSSPALSRHRTSSRSLHPGSAAANAPLSSRSTPADSTEQLIGRYRYDRRSGAWWWSAEMFSVHGLQPGAAEPCAEVLLHHQHPED